MIFSLIYFKGLNVWFTKCPYKSRKEAAKSAHFGCIVKNQLT